MDKLFFAVTRSLEKSHGTHATTRSNSTPDPFGSGRPFERVGSEIR